MNNNYYCIDGSALISQIKRLWKKSLIYKNKKLDPLEFVSNLMYAFPELGSTSYKRATFYFPTGENDLNKYLLMPDMKSPGLIRDIHFKYCGEKLKGSQSYNNWLETVPSKHKDKCVKSEKGIDMEICCDVLKLASFGKIDRLFLLTNDRDFLPLCRTLKDFGVNISLIQLSINVDPNKLLLNECDSYDVLDEEKLKKVFKIDLKDQSEQNNISPTPANK